MDPHSEIELKYAASAVTPEDFNGGMPAFLEKVYPGINKTFIGRKPSVKYTSMEKGIDTFYGLGGTVVRHRRLSRGTGGELTIKNRHNVDSTLSRTEVDLHLSGRDDGAVDTFMGLLNAQYLFTLRKDYDLWEIDIPMTVGDTCEISNWTEVRYSLDIVRYTAFPVARYDREYRPLTVNEMPRQPHVGPTSIDFIEVEVGKHSKVENDEAMAIVGSVGVKLSEHFNLGKPLNVSLFEHFKKVMV